MQIAPSFKHPGVARWLVEDAAFAGDHRVVQEGIVANVVRRETKATSGVTLQYLLNLSTVILLPSTAPSVCRLLWRTLRAVLEQLRVSECMLVGPEAAGGMLVAQMASTCPADLASHVGFVYMRKARKKTGTGNQLEGLDARRVRPVIWIDDTFSTGSSLLAGEKVQPCCVVPPEPDARCKLLKAEYGLSVVAALYLVDRNHDRRPPTVYAAPPCPVFTVMDLDGIQLRPAL